MYSFFSDYRYFGEHARMTDDLLISNGGIFDTVYDAYFSAAVIGFFSSEPSAERGSREKDKTILADKLTRELDKTNLIIRTLLLSDNSMEISGDLGRTERAISKFTDPQIAEMNKKYIEKYAFKGLEILHEEFQRSKGKNDLVTFAKELVEKYTSYDMSDMYSLISNLVKS